MSMYGVPSGITNPPRHSPQVDEENERLHTAAHGLLGPTPGTVVLVLVFLLAFVAYYFVNWKLLSLVWKIG